MGPERRKDFGTGSSRGCALGKGKSEIEMKAQKRYYVLLSGEEGWVRALIWLLKNNNVRLDRSHYRKINKESKDGKAILRIVRRSA